MNLVSCEQWLGDNLVSVTQPYPDEQDSDNHDHGGGIDPVHINPD
jgi:hypothetical protein